MNPSASGAEIKMRILFSNLAFFNVLPDSIECFHLVKKNIVDFKTIKKFN